MVINNQIDYQLLKELCESFIITIKAYVHCECYKERVNGLYHLVCSNILEEDVKQCCNTNQDDDTLHDDDYIASIQLT